MVKVRLGLTICLHYIFWALYFGVSTSLVAALGFLVLEAYSFGSIPHFLSLVIGLAMWSVLIGTSAILSIAIPAGIFLAMGIMTLMYRYNRLPYMTIVISSLIFYIIYGNWILNLDESAGFLLADSISPNYMYIFIAIPIVVTVSLMLAARQIVQQNIKEVDKPKRKMKDD